MIFALNLFLPALIKAGWAVEKQIREEVFFTQKKQAEELLYVMLREVFEEAM